MRDIGKCRKAIGWIAYVPLAALFIVAMTAEALAIFTQAACEATLTWIFDGGSWWEALRCELDWRTSA